MSPLPVFKVQNKLHTHNRRVASNIYKYSIHIFSQSNTLLKSFFSAKKKYFIFMIQTFPIKSKFFEKKNNTFLLKIYIF